MEAIRELIERLEKATGPSREIDGAIWCAVNGHEFVQWDGAGCVYRWPDAPNWDRGIKHVPAELVPKVTASIDAAVALVEKVLPGWKRQMFENYTGTWIARVSSPRRQTFSTDYMREREPDGSPNGALALCLALLRAIEAQGGGT